MSILQTLFNFVLLISLLKGINTNENNITDDKAVNSTEKTVTNKTIVPADVERFSDQDLVKILVNNSQSLERTYIDKHEIKVSENNTRRKSRDILNSSLISGIQCYTCHGKDSSKESSDCFSGISIPLKKCGDAEQCFVELNPLYIKRGCVLPGRVNRTFICKCPLCNDKPSFDISHYEYKKLNDWEFDNARLQTPVTGMELMCKVCDTKGMNPSSDKNCRFGKNNCSEVKQSKKRLPYFRRKVEELGDRDFFKTTESDDPRNLVSFLVKNVKEIFDDIIDIDNNSEKSTKGHVIKKKIIRDKKRNRSTQSRRFTTTTVNFESMYIDTFTTQQALICNSSASISTSTPADDEMLDENLPLTTLLDKQEISENDVLSLKDEHLQLSNAIKEYPGPDKRERDIVGLVSAQQFRVNSSVPESEVGDLRRSCIMCNNVATEDCYSPKNKLIPSVMCEHDDDVCYSLHTPFGIVDRGCYNVNHNMSTYVCSCNLCNYISISEMPLMFSKKRDWVDNVIELSRTRHLRKSVFKDMSCLRCEVNTTTKTGDMLDSANCLEGNIGNLPVEDCRVGEICAVKVLKADGYIWRGCVEAPLYNYWWAVCDRDLCNYDPPVFLHDFVIIKS
ncbi:hypothetical protein HF086_016827 [Spodoptera exigua]|uniref:Uncharacterized protein n=1 Tax=Spodoptera exigua TaxID=7107 RepID=A0A922M0C2_SPOEX|nr:hypothetical protein HF086_016827 [Spodoptera exigua]